MIRQLELYNGKGFDPHYNLAVEQCLMETVEDDCCILYLWQNENTVVIGRNQNAWKECRTALLEREGGRLARRLSGGGAVYHDLGNLNFTFLVPTAEYDLDRQLAVIVTACRSLGIQAERSGRNDVLSAGRKFSGNAFYQYGSRSYHHGTLLVDTDMERMTRYLNPSLAKLKGKGVDSVRSRVVNLKELCPSAGIPLLKEALKTAFQQVYGLPCAARELGQDDHAAIDMLYNRNRSWEWNFGRNIPFSFSCEGRFAWGGIEIALLVDGGIVRQAKVYSDAMDWRLAPRLEAAFTGCRLTADALCAAADRIGLEERKDVCRLLAEQGI